MNYTSISIKDARNNFAELIEQVALTNASFLVTKFGKPKALIVAPTLLKKQKKDKLAILKKTAGMWANRKDMKDGASWVSELRKKTSTRYGTIFS